MRKEPTRRACGDKCADTHVREVRPCRASLRLSINPEMQENGKEGCARLARRTFRSATGRSPALSAKMNLGRVPCAIQIRFQDFLKVLKS